MVYEFMGKIKNINKLELLEEDSMRENLDALKLKFEVSFEIRVLKDRELVRDVMVIGKTSVSTFVRVFEDDLAKAIKTFKAYLYELADILNGEVNTSEGFYNETKTFSRLW